MKVQAHKCFWREIYATHLSTLFPGQLFFKMLSTLNFCNALSYGFDICWFCFLSPIASHFQDCSCVQSSVAILFLGFSRIGYYHEKRDLDGFLRVLTSDCGTRLIHFQVVQFKPPKPGIRGSAHCSLVHCLPGGGAVSCRQVIWEWGTLASDVGWGAAGFGGEEKQPGQGGGESKNSTAQQNCGAWVGFPNPGAMLEIYADMFIKLTR